MNAIFQEYKKQSDECKVVFVEDLEVPYKIKCTELVIDEKGKYNRPKKKKEDRKLIKDYLGEER